VEEQQAPAEQLIDTSKLYDHLVKEHGWERRPYLLGQRLHDLHRLEHTEAELGMVRLVHEHPAPPAPAGALPMAGGLVADLPQVS
jgi:hypothetical protein